MVSPLLNSRRIRPAFDVLEERVVPAVFNVNSTDDVLDPPGGTVTLRSAIQAANQTPDPNGNTINLTVPGTYQITLPGADEDGNATGDFDILGGADLTIANTSGGAVTVDGGRLDRVFDVNPDGDAAPFTVSFQDFSIEFGAVSRSGGGIRFQGDASLSLTRMLLAFNSAGGDGGAIESFIGRGSLTVSASRFLQNEAGDDGGAIATIGPHLASISDSLLDGNSSGASGGGLWVAGTTLRVQSSSFIANQAAVAGSGLELLSTGVGAAGSTLTNVTLADNHGAANGGGIDVPEQFSGELTLVNDTIDGNSADAGGGIFWGGRGQVSVRNTILAGNAAAVGPDAAAGRVFTAELTGGQQVPTPADAATLLLGPDQVSATLRVTFTGLSGPPTGARLRVAPAGQNDPNFAALDLNLDYLNLSMGPAGTYDGLGTQTLTVDPAFVARLLAGDVYLELDTDAFPDAGELRGRLTPVAAFGAFTDLGGNVIGVGGLAGGNNSFTAQTTRTGTPDHPLDPLLDVHHSNGGPTVGPPGGQFTTAVRTQALLAGSPAIDAGVTDGAPAVDARGVPRSDGRPDAGAFESDLHAAVAGGGGGGGGGGPTPNTPPPIPTTVPPTSVPLPGPAAPLPATPAVPAGPTPAAADLSGLQAEAAALFRALVGRDPSADQLAELVRRIEAGATPGQLKGFVFATPDYYKLRGKGTARGFLRALYKDVLGTGSPRALARDLVRLRHHVPRTEIIQDLLRRAGQA
jgi:CHRD domain